MPRLDGAARVVNFSFNKPSLSQPRFGTLPEEAIEPRAEKGWNHGGHPIWQSKSCSMNFWSGRSDVRSVSPAWIPEVQQNPMFVFGWALDSKSMAGLS
jgi:hypothetical protein